MDMNNWLKEQRAHNRRQGTDYREMASHPNRLTLYTHNELRSMTTALDLLLARLPHPGMRGEEQREKWEQERGGYVESLVHVMYRLGNALSALGVSDGELSRFLRAILTADQMPAGPSADKTRRALDAAGEPWTCARCGNKIPAEVQGLTTRKGSRVCSAGCLKAADTQEMVLVPGPDVSAADITEIPDDEEA